MCDGDCHQPSEKGKKTSSLHYSSPERPTGLSGLLVRLALTALKARLIPPCNTGFHKFTRGQ
jgi:hypothetical protein